MNVLLKKPHRLGKHALASTLVLLSWSSTRLNWSMDVCSATMVLKALRCQGVLTPRRPRRPFFQGGCPAPGRLGDAFKTMSAT
jgi:hypothetical protein